TMAALLPSPPPRYRLILRFLFAAPPPPAPYTLSLHDALPICIARARRVDRVARRREGDRPRIHRRPVDSRGGAQNLGRRCIRGRSEEHTSELQSRFDLVCRLLLEKKKKNEHTRLVLAFYTNFI